MTKIIITYNSNNDITHIEISGHAESDDYGKDIVCASISLVAISIVKTLECIKEDDVVTDKKTGYMSIAISLKISKADKIRLAVFLLQLESIAKKYKKYVVIKKEKK